MYGLFYDLIYKQLFNQGSTNLSQLSKTVLNNTNLPFDKYLSMFMALICTIIVYVVCCLLVVKVIKLFGRLWTRF